MAVLFFWFSLYEIIDVKKNGRKVNVNKGILIKISPKAKSYLNCVQDWHTVGATLENAKRNVLWAYINGSLRRPFLSTHYHATRQDLNNAD